jgi:hypothetical protein
MGQHTMAARQMHDEPLDRHLVGVEVLLGLEPGLSVLVGTSIRYPEGRFIRKNYVGFRVVKNLLLPET